MKPMNIAAHDHEQLNIARFFHGLYVFYERRQNEWKNEKKLLLPNYINLTMKDVAQWLAVTHAGIGLGTARARVKDLFSEPRYGNIFSQFGDDLSAPQYGDLCLATLAALIVKRWIAQLSSAKKGSARISQLLFIRLVYRALKRSEIISSSRERLIADREFKHVKMDGSLDILNMCLTDVLSAHKAFMKTEASVDLSNFFKRDQLTGALADEVEAGGLVQRLSMSLEKAFATA
jgi:hypothetical protein